MTFLSIGKLAGAIALTVGLAACIDVTMDVEVLSETTGKATVTSVMGADIYPMVKAGAASGDSQSADNGFCKEEGSVLTENADGSATCVQVTEGNFADLMKDDSNKQSATFTVVSPGVVRAAMKTADMKADLNASTGSEEQMDDETKAMMAAFFEGRALTVKFSGREILESNMDIAADKKSATKVIPFLDLINGTVDLPDELYAVIKVN